jgi:hypothetical protein
MNAEESDAAEGDGNERLCCAKKKEMEFSSSSFLVAFLD